MSRPSAVGPVGSFGPVLILGGTGEARALAGLLHPRGIDVVSSLAGRVAQPRLPVGPTRIGGFGGVDGLVRWIDAHDARVVVDATHPFAQRISTNAAAAANRTSTPLLAIRRPEWTPTHHDRWTRVPDVAAAAAHLAGDATRENGAHHDDTRVFLTTGRQDVGAFAHVDGCWFLIRVVDPPTAPLPPRHRLLRSRGPYDLASERELMRTNAIDVLVTKNSGGALTRAKLTAAAELGMEVMMVDRPTPTRADHVVATAEAAARWITARDAAVR